MLRVPHWRLARHNPRPQQLLQLGGREGSLRGGSRGRQ
jgi:hypothetical protein